MSGADGGVGRGVGRAVALGVALALALLLLAAKEARAARYSVAQCGWHAGADADWADTTAGVKFRSQAYCATPASADPWDGVHLRSLTRDGQVRVWGTRLARWRWQAPPGTGIIRVSGTWWHALHDGMQQRLGVGAADGGFDPFAIARDTNLTLRDFVAGFWPPRSVFEDRLLCARAESEACSLDPGSWSAVRALTITLEDDAVPAAGVGGELTAGGWRRGTQALGFWGTDVGGGVRFGETLLDGARVAFAAYPCAEALIASEWRGTRMRPCESRASGTATLATTSFSDGPHTLGQCATDFAGNLGCASPSTVLIDNNPPAQVREPVLAGGDGWRRVDDFELGWANPDQGRASPIGGASWRIVGPAGYDSGVRFVAGHGLNVLGGLRVPGPGAYSLQVWLRDEAGNEAPASAVSVPLRFDDVAPAVAFAPETGEGGLPETVHAEVFDAHSGPAGGSIGYRRLGAEQWTVLPTALEAGGEAGAARLLARLPDNLAPGIYVLRADAVDGAGNAASTTRRADGTLVALRKPAPPPPAAAEGAKGAPSARRRRTRRVARPRIVLHATPRALRTGESVRLDGRVGARGVPLPRRGKLVAIQYFESAARRWRPVLLTRTDRRGRFHARYRFRYVRGRARIRLRAAALAEEGWPYRTRTSRPVTLRVSG
jgi:hypothetical protein